jgi:hypothetical protein
MLFAGLFMRKFALTIRLLYRLTVIGLFCIFATTSEVSAAENIVKVVQNGILKNNLAMRFQVGEIFTDKVVKFLNRGFTIRIDYNIELWESRGYWFDRLYGQRNISYQLDFEPLEKRYVCKRSLEGSSIISKTDKQLDNLLQWIMRPELPITFVPVEQLGPESKYYYNIGILLATLTAENVRDLQKWMSEFNQQEEETSSFAKTTFKIVMDFLSSRNHKKISVKSDEFYLSDLPKLSK